MLKNETPGKGGVVELRDDWQQVGSLLGPVLSRLKVASEPSTRQAGDTGPVMNERSMTAQTSPRRAA